MKKIIMRLAIIFSTIYIIWRFTTLPFNWGIKSSIFGLVLLILEVWDFFEFLIYYRHTVSVKKVEIKKKEIKDWPEIDIVIATINEEKSLLERTIKACKNIEYEDLKKVHIYIADDGNRKNIEELAKQYEINYITRSNNINAKAGNYNHALRIMKSPYLLTLDADMAPKKTILKDLMPYLLVNKKIGFVQAPQSFENPDIFQTRFRIKNDIPYDQSFFYNHLQNNKNNINAVVNCGTNVIFNRKALDEIGGFCIGTLTEDIATGMMIQNAGYKGIYVNKEEAVGYQESDLTSFIKQRKRWARGCIQTAKKYKLRKLKGLDDSQKTEYFTCFSYWLFGIKRIMFLIIPVLFSAFNIVLINSKLYLFLLFWLPQYLIKRFAIDKIYENERSSTWNKIYEIILAPALGWEVLKEIFGFKKSKFEVSKKSKQKQKGKLSKERLQLIIGHLVLFGINVYGYYRSILMFNYEVLDVLSLIWCLSNIGYLSIALIFDFSNGKESKKKYVKTKKYDRFAILKLFVK